jgi:large subunit ribosomal protein L13e
LRARGVHRRGAPLRVPANPSLTHLPLLAFRRSIAREKKAAAIFPRPTAGALRPVVHPPTQRYNFKTRLGRGFTLEELKAAGISKKMAPTIGIAVDHRRRNRSEESLALNSKRLKAYKASLILFPRRTAKPKHGDSEAGELSLAAQLKGKLMPIVKEAKPLEMVTVTEEMSGFKAYQKLRTERMNVWQVGPRIKKAEEAAKKAEEDAKVAKMK